VNSDAAQDIARRQRVRVTARCAVLAGAAPAAARETRSVGAQTGTSPLRYVAGVAGRIQVQGRLALVTGGMKK
jgi:hypothetical protein